MCINENAGYEICDVCGCHVLIPWSDMFRDEFEIPNGTVICTEQCYWDRLADEAEHKADWRMDR